MWSLRLKVLREWNNFPKHSLTWQCSALLPQFNFKPKHIHMCNVWEEVVFDHSGHCLDRTVLILTSALSHPGPRDWSWWSWGTKSVECRGSVRRTAEVCEVLRSVRAVKASPVVDEIGRELHCCLVGKNPNHSRRRTWQRVWGGHESPSHVWFTLINITTDPLTNLCNTWIRPNKE